MNSQTLEAKLFNSRVQSLIAKVIEGAVTGSGHHVDALFDASFYILLEKSENGMESYVVVRAVSFREHGKGRC